MADVINERHTVEYHSVRRRLDALQAACKQPRARCIGMLEAEYKDHLKRKLAALDVLFDELADTGHTSGCEARMGVSGHCSCTGKAKGDHDGD